MRSFIALSFAASAVVAEPQDKYSCALADEVKWADFVMEDAHQINLAADIEAKTGEEDVEKLALDAEEQISKARKSKFLGSDAHIAVENAVNLLKDAEQVAKFQDNETKEMKLDAESLKKTDDVTEFEASPKQKDDSIADLLQTERLDEKKLADILKNSKEGEKSLIVFYAKWCPHCQTYVLHDTQGNKKNAPLDQFNTILHKGAKATEDTKKINVFAFDTSSGSVPKEFPVKYIPTVFVMEGAGKKVEKFEGNPHDFKKLTKFALEV